MKFFTSLQVPFFFFLKKVLARLDELITWSRMRFKAKKSRSLTFLKGRQRQCKFSIAGKNMPTVKEKPVKSLGRWYAETLSDRGRGIEIMHQAEEGDRKYKAAWKVQDLVLAVWTVPTPCMTPLSI